MPRPGSAAIDWRDAVLEEASEDHRPARRQFQRGLGAAHLERGNRDVAELDGALLRQFGDLGLHAQADAALGQDDRGEGERDTVGLELDGDVAVLIAAGGHRELAAGQERGVLAGNGGQRRLGEGAEEAGLLEGLNGRPEVDVFVV